MSSASSRCASLRSAPVSKTSAAALLFSGFIPLFAAEAAAQVCQWQGMQVNITQVRAPQIQPTAHPLLGACSRIIHFFVCCQEPLDIGTTQFHPLERINASFRIRDLR